MIQSKTSLVRQVEDVLNGAVHSNNDKERTIRVLFKSLLEKESTSIVERSFILFLDSFLNYYVVR